MNDIENDYLNTLKKVKKTIAIKEVVVVKDSILNAIVCFNFLPCDGINDVKESVNDIIDDIAKDNDIVI